MTVSLKVKCHENPLMAVMNKMLVCMHCAMKCRARMNAGKNVGGKSGSNRLAYTGKKGGYKVS